MHELIEHNKTAIIAICDQFKVERMYAFGSVVGVNFNDKSDIDILLIFREDLCVRNYTSYFFEIKYRLENLLTRSIDLITQRSLTNPYLIQSINDTKQLIYEFKNKKIIV
ncbi:MAG TPA: nucleotidyltransferase domain-containing protein [Leeuwenhoekiella sp.]|nr:nucleotidyltransferase domain-containing protein [Leeuwenhoekiella sp.]